MSARPAFDTAVFEEQLISAGVEPQQAKAHRAALSIVLAETSEALATKRDLESLATKRDFEVLKDNLRDFEHRTDQRFAEMTLLVKTFIADQAAATNAMGLRLSEAMRIQGLAIIGAMVAVAGVTAAFLRLFP